MKAATAKQITDLQEQIASLEKQRMDELLHSGIALKPDVKGANEIEVRVAQKSTDALNAEADVIKLQAEYDAAQKAQAASDIFSVTKVQQDKQIQDLQIKLAELKEKKAALLQQYTEQWPEVKLVIRADSAFSRDDIMSWCEKHGVDYVLGLARNARLERMIASEMEQARAESERTGLPFRSYKDFEYQTLESWSCARRVVGKVEYLVDKPNARFVVTSLSRSKCKSRYLYEKVYCARGDMENRIKECQLDLYADRTSTATMHANQLRLWFASMAYVLLCALRRIGLQDT